MSSHLLDTSMLIEFFEGTERGARACALIEEKSAAISIVTLAEFSDVASRKKADARQAIAFIRKNIPLIPLSVTASEQVGKLKAERRKNHSSFSIFDALIYLTAQENGLQLVTKDNDFAGLAGVTIV